MNNKLTPSEIEAEKQYPRKNMGDYIADRIAFVNGANWQKEQNSELLKALELIASWLGNLPDERYTSRTGPNDAAARGQMAVSMRHIAKETLKKYNNE